MWKYILGSLVFLAALGGAVFVLIANLHDDGPQGPAPVVTITVDDARLTPAVIEVSRDQLVEFQLVNNGTLQRVMTTNTDKVEQLPAETTSLGKHTLNNPLRYVQIQAGPGGATSALVRFTESGQYELRVDTAGRPEPPQVATVRVRS